MRPEDLLCPTPAGLFCKPGDFHIFAWPDEEAGLNRFEISIPKGASLILTHRTDGLFPGLNSVPEVVIWKKTMMRISASTRP